MQVEQPHGFLVDVLNANRLEVPVELTSLVRGQKNELRTGKLQVEILDELLDSLHCLDSVESWHLEVSEHVGNLLAGLSELGELEHGFLSVVYEFALVLKAELLKLLLENLHVVELIFCYYYLVAVGEAGHLTAKVALRV